MQLQEAREGPLNALRYIYIYVYISGVLHAVWFDTTARTTSITRKRNRV